ncbi:MAG TPA: extracellular solute-binding protein [Limnochordia bacterium]|nr:extracellular solute-binding protein [Limnochordia bacterium]
MGGRVQVSRTVIAFGSALGAALMAVNALAAPVEITYYHRSDQTEADWAKAVIQRFNASHPDIVVKDLPSGTGGGSDYVEHLTALRASGESPDVFYGSTDKLGFIINGWALDLSALINRDRSELALDQFFNGSWEPLTKGGKVYGVPLTLTPQLLYYNKDMFRASGLALLPTDWNDTTWTWDVFLADSKKLTQQKTDGGYKQLALTQATESNLPDVPWMFGGDFFPADAYKTSFADHSTFTRQENIDAYTALQDYYARYAAAGPDKGIDAWSGFQNGQVAMDWIGAWKMNTYLVAAGSGGMKFAWGIAPTPLVLNRANTRWDDPLYVASDTKHVEAAWSFVKYATGPEGQALWAEMTGKIPARRTALDAYVQKTMQASGMTRAEVLSAVSGGLDHGRTSLEESIAYAPAWIGDLTDKWMDPMLAGKMPVKEALTNLQTIIDGKLADALKKK